MEPLCNISLVSLSPVLQNLETLTLLVVSHEDELLNSTTKARKQRQVIAKFNLTGFVDNDCLDGDKTGETGRHQTVRRQHAEGAEDDPRSQQQPLVCDDVVCKLVGANDIISQPLVKMLVPTKFDQPTPSEPAGIYHSNKKSSETKILKSKKPTSASFSAMCLTATFD